MHHALRIDGVLLKVEGGCTYERKGRVILETSHMGHRMVLATQQTVATACSTCVDTKSKDLTRGNAGKAMDKGRAVKESCKSFSMHRAYQGNSLQVANWD